jgi:cation diffusion facilitator family transporter
MPMTRLDRGLRATLLGMVVNLVLVCGKLVAGILGHSHALVADAVESLTDIFSSVVVWRSLVVADEPADDEHPYGHGKAEPIAGAMVATMLLFAAVGIVVTAVQSMMAAEHPGPRPYTLLVLIVVVVTKEVLFRFVRREAETIDSAAVHSDAWHHRNDAITSLAAAAGITVSLIGGPGYEKADDVAAIAAAFIIAFNGVRLIRPSLNELMDSSASPELVEDIRQTAAAMPGVEGVEKCLVRKAGHLYYVDMHVEVAALMTVERSHLIAHDVKDKVREKFPNVRDVLIHIEPAGLAASRRAAAKQ